MEFAPKNAEKVESPTPDEAWRRFTLLDLLILFSGHEAALGIMKWIGWLDFETSSEREVRQILAKIAIFLLLGGCLITPLILLIQFLSRHRNARMGGGEFFAIYSGVYWLVFFVMLFLVHNLSALLFGFFAIVSVFCFMLFALGGIMFFVNAIAKNESDSCRWLSTYGFFLSLVSALSLILIVFNMIWAFDAAF